MPLVSCSALRVAGERCAAQLRVLAFWAPSCPTARTPPRLANLRETGSSESARTFF